MSSSDEWWLFVDAAVSLDTFPDGTLDARADGTNKGTLEKIEPNSRCPRQWENRECWLGVP